MERQEFLREILLAAYLTWLFDVGRIWYMWDGDQANASVKGMSAWLEPSEGINLPWASKMSTGLAVWNKFSFSRASVVSSFCTSIDDWANKHRPPKSVYLFFALPDTFEAYQNLIDKVRRAQYKKCVVWTYLFEPCSQFLIQMGFVESKQEKKFQFDSGELPIWTYTCVPKGEE